MKENKNKVLVPKLTLYLRGAVGIYLLYTVSVLWQGVMEKAGTEKLLILFFMAFFSITGILLLVFSGRALLRGRYLGGPGEEAQKEEE